MSNRRAVVIGGGGVAGIAWEVGILHGLLEAGVALNDADAIIGTSAGSFAGSYLASNTVARWYAAQLEGVGQEIAAPWAEDWLVEVEAAIAEGGQEPAAVSRALAAMALRREVASQAERMDVVKSRIDGPEWPDGPLMVTAIDADSGELHLINRDQGIPFPEAVAASGAVPGVWPVVSTGGRRWIDGGCISVNNAGLAHGSDVVIILALRTDGLVRTMPGLDHEVDVLREEGTRVEVIVPDASSAAVLGDNPFDPTVRGAAAQAGYRQALACAAQVATTWDPADAPLQRS
ncbi:patatin-like phospholipase family protein [Arthrobacter sp. M4]|uniref:patatin-like phospholipase family protein n=1 Tax=Arthrobacter sp. M4 TaxID=218160 RepID=UPI001CDBC58E|nr:patatin-like phospholipase family protein [Arthrobacter sp. M4]MCA4135685.1 patatin-like phospholipase family protein [Arthrobacter sp. M4]